MASEGQLETTRGQVPELEGKKGGGEGVSTKEREGREREGRERGGRGG